MMISNLVGKPYCAGASGPDAFDCIGLVRFWLKQDHGLDLPAYTIEQTSYRDLLRFARATGWRPTHLRPQPDDIITMEGLEGKHVGVMVRTCEGPMLLHAVGNNQRGQVVVQPLLSLLGYRKKQVWRRAP